MKPNIAGLKAQDVLVLCKMIASKGLVFKQSDLAQSIGLSQPEVGYALKRLQKASLLSEDKRTVHKFAAIEFLVHAVKFFFSPDLGQPTRGVPTSYSFHPIKNLLHKDLYEVVWPHAEGSVSGMSLLPIYETMPEAALKDPLLHLLLSLVDIIRTKWGMPRVRDAAIEEITKLILGKELSQSAGS